ncbi:MAG: hypothetical protein EZS28_003623 [Streblomastix strix]|uniref:Uncharacterized protein n=1 Tax=Streblomastix strix TaxID=222440 RepID=A0A5J4X123_9EUKA|nr:MAG: hypothetical protein EZS28_003623 [Streblomastix strix]
MSFNASDYLVRLSKASHSDYVSSHSALNEVLRTLTIETQSLTLSKQEFFDKPRNTLTLGGTRQTRAQLGARGSATCCCIQACQVNWIITIPANTIGIQLNRVNTTKDLLINIEFARSRTNFIGTKTATTALAADIKQTTQKFNIGEVLKFWLGFSIACGPFQQIAICRDNTKLWETSIYAREQAIIRSNSLSDLTVNNSVTVSPLESIFQGKRHYGVFLDLPLVEVAAASTTTAYFYRYPKDITFSGVMDLNQLNPIFNEFPVLTRNYASLYLQLWMTDFLQDLKVVWLNKFRSFDTCLAYAMIPAVKPDIFTLLDDSDPPASEYYTVRLINCRDLGNADTYPQNRTQMKTIMSFSNIKSVFMTFAMQQYPTWFFPLLMKKIDLIIDQKHATPNPYEALTADVNAPSDHYRSLTFENININDKNYQYGKDDEPAEQQDNVFFNTTLFRGFKAIKTYYPNKFMLAWKLATDDSFMRGCNSTKIGARTNIQVILHNNIANGIIDNFKVLDTDPATTENQNNFTGFIGTRSYPISTQIAQTPLVHFLCDSIIRIMFDDAPEPQILNLEVIGEIGGSMIVAG